MENNHYIFVVGPGKDYYCSLYNPEIKYSIGSEYNDHIEVFKDIEDTLAKYPWPYSKTYLEVSATDTFLQNGELYSNNFYIVRKIDLSELREKSAIFDSACINNENKIAENDEEVKLQIAALRAELEAKMQKDKAIILVSLMPLSLVIIGFLIVILLYFMK